MDAGFTSHSFDVIVASGAVSSTRDIQRTLRNIKRLLDSEGLLLLLEMPPQRSLDLTFGCLDQWWNFQDQDLRKSSPLLEPETWQLVLGQVGFKEVSLLSDRDGKSQPQQSLIMAKGPRLAARTAAASPTSEPHTWLLFSDGKSPRSLGMQVAKGLRNTGNRVVTVTRGDRFRRLSKERFQVAPQRIDDFLELLQTLKSEGAECEQIVHLWNSSPNGLMDTQEESCLSVIHLVQGLVQSTWLQSPRLWLISSGAQGMNERDQTIQPRQAPLWGLGRVLMNEHSELQCKLVDLHANGSRTETISSLLVELQAPDEEDEILLCGEARYVHRIRKVSASSSANDPGRPHGKNSASSFRLEFTAPGSLDNLLLQEVPRQKPGPGQVEIEVEAAGLNFRDVMWAMGLLTGEALEDGFAGPTLGMECAGRVTTVGEGVENLQIGDEVIAFAPHALGAFVVTDARAVAPKPRHLNFEEAATIPTVFMTAHYALESLARLQEGERVLIHGAAGGVGLAAVQIAQYRQAEIFGTAGSSEKRDFLRLLGVNHVMNSRALDFAEEVMEITEGEGVDVVLNSLAGEAIPKSLNLLKPFGRFLEIGKRDFYANSRLGLRPFRNNLSYFGIDADQILLGRSNLAQSLLQEILDRFENRIYEPLPHRIFPISRVVEAFRHMQQSKHIGKIVISTQDSRLEVKAQKPEQLRLSEQATFLITGGLGGFGLATAQWMVQKGARNLVLVGQRGAATEESRRGVTALEEAGARVLVAKADVTQENQVRDLLSRIEANLPPLKGIVHAAMVLDDGIVLRLGRQRLMRVMEPKILGAWNLHRQTQQMPLDFFVMFSSGTTLVGNPGQANYVAANLFLEALAYSRRSHGLPALTVSWGAISEVGYLARHSEVQELLKTRMGLRSLTPKQALDTLEKLLLADFTQVAVADFDWRQWQKVSPSSSSPKYGLVHTGQEENLPNLVVEDFRESLLALEPTERQDFLVAQLAEHVGKILGLPGSRVDTGRPITDLGLDSLMGVELHSELEAYMDLKIPVMQLMQGQTIQDLADCVLDDLGVGEGAGEMSSQSA